jgi:hypothetical protein
VDETTDFAQQPRPKMGALWVQASVLHGYSQGKSTG